MEAKGKIILLSGHLEERDVEIINKALEEAKQAGIREVVEWIKEHGSIDADYTDDLHMVRSWLELPMALWQAFLKEKGIDAS